MRFTLLKRWVRSPGVPAYRGVDRIGASFVAGFVRLDVFGHGFWIDWRKPRRGLGVW